jgi:hypothetical protein
VLPDGQPAGPAPAARHREGPARLFEAIVSACGSANRPVHARGAATQQRYPRHLASGPRARCRKGLRFKPCLARGSCSRPRGRKSVVAPRRRRSMRFPSSLPPHPAAAHRGPPRHDPGGSPRRARPRSRSARAAPPPTSCLSDAAFLLRTRSFRAREGVRGARGPAAWRMPALPSFAAGVTTPRARPERAALGGLPAKEAADWENGSRRHERRGPGACRGRSRGVLWRARASLEGPEEHNFAARSFSAPAPPTEHKEALDLLAEIAPEAQFGQEIKDDPERARCISTGRWTRGRGPHARQSRPDLDRARNVWRKDLNGVETREEGSRSSSSADRRPHRPRQVRLRGSPAGRSEDV